MLGGRRAYKTKLCTLWQRGRCSRVSCNFAHGDAELRRFSYSSSSSFHHHHPPPPPPPAQGYGRRDYRNSDLRSKLDRRYSPRRRYSPGRDARGHHSLHDQRPGSRDRGSSDSRSSMKKSDRKRKRMQLDDGETNSSRSLKISDNSEDRKQDKFSSGDEKDDLEQQLKQIQLDMDILHEDRSRLEILLDKKVDEARKISSRIDDLESELSREKEESRRIMSKMKKFTKAHTRYVKAQEELRRSQARFQRLGYLLASDPLKPAANEEGSSMDAAGDEDPHVAYEMSPSDQRQNHVSSARRRSIPCSTTSEEAKTGKKRREKYSDVIPRSEKCRFEGAVPESDNNSKGTETTKSLSVKKRKLGEEDNKQGNVSSSNVAEKVKGPEVKHVFPSTGMAAHAVDEFIKAIEMEDNSEPMEAANSLENDDVGNATKSSYMPPPPPPLIQNPYKQYEGDDEEVDVD